MQLDSIKFKVKSAGCVGLKGSTEECLQARNEIILNCLTLVLFEGASHVAYCPNAPLRKTFNPLSLDQSISFYDLVSIRLIYYSTFDADFQLF